MTKMPPAIGGRTHLEIGPLMDNETRAEVLERTTELARLARNIERAGRLAPRHRLDATVAATVAYHDALGRFRLFLSQRTNFALSTPDFSS